MATTSKEIAALKLEHSQVTRTKSIFNKDQTQLLYQKTPEKHMYTRPGKGGGTWKFPKSYFIRQKLNSLFGFDWDFEILTTLPEAFAAAEKTGSCVVQGKLTGRVVDDQGRIRPVTRMQWGRSEIKWIKGRDPDSVARSGKDELPKPMDFGNDMKAATTDCLKKCASQLGIAADIYDSDEFVELTISDSTEDKGSKTAGRLAKKIKKNVIESDGAKVGGQNGSKKES